MEKETMEKKVLLFGFNKLPEILAVQDAVSPFGAELIPVPPGDTGRTLSDLAGLDEEESDVPPGGALPVGRMAVFCGLQGELDALLPALAAAGAGPGCLKAVLTVHNRSWSAARLYGELLREHEAVTGNGRR